MPIKTQMRLSQITGSFAAVGNSRSIITTEPASTIATMSEADLSGSLSHIASALGRIHGKASGEAFNNAPGEFYHAIVPDSSGGQDIGSTSNEWGDIFVADLKALKLGSGQEHSIADSNAGLVIGSTQAIKIGVDANTQAIDIGTINQAKTITIGNDASTIVDVNALEIELDAATGIKIDSAGTAADAIDINSAGGLDVDVADEISLTTTSADGHISLVSAHTAGVAVFIDANADAGSIVDIDAGILQVDVTGVAGINSGGTLSLGTANSGVAVNIGHGTSEVTVGDNLSVAGNATITGDLTVNGTTTQLDVTNLNVEDPFILMGGKATAANSNTGLIFMSGSSTGAARPDITFARGGNDVWHLGSIASNSGSITSATAATMDIAFKAGEIQVFEAATRLKQTANSLHIESDESILLDAKSAGAVEYKFAGQTKGLVKLASNDLVVSSSVAALSLRSATGGVELFDTHDAGNNALQMAKVFFDAGVTNGAALELGTAAYGGIIKTIGGKNLTLAQTGVGYLELGVNDNAGNGYLALSGSGVNVTLNVGAGNGSDGFVAKEGKLAISGSALVLDNGAGDTAQLQFKSNNTNYIRLQAPTSVGATYTLTLPPTDGNTDQVLKTNGSGVLDWVNQPVAGSAAAIKRVGTLAALVAKDTAVNFNTGATFVENAVQLDVGAVQAAARINAIDVYVNGQLLSSGTSAPGSNVAGGDYVLVDTAGSGAGSPGQATLKFAFSLEADDVLSVIVRG